MRFLSDQKVFYPVCMLISCILLFATYLLAEAKPDFLLAVLNIIAFVFTILLIEKIITEIYNGPLVEVRGILMLFLLLSPYIQYNQYMTSNVYLSLFFFVFAFFNYVLYEKSTDKWFLMISILAVIFLTYFYSYSLVAFLPVFLLIIFKAKWYGVFYFIITAAVITLLLKFNFIAYYLIIQWDLNNFFSSNYGLISYKTPNILFAFFPLFHPIFFSAGIVVLPLIRTEDFESDALKITFVSYVFYALFVAGLPFQHYDMLIITFPFIFIILYPAITRVINLTEYFRPGFKRYLPYFTLVIQLFLFFLLVTGYITIQF
jgi:hypothetical protein